MEKITISREITVQFRDTTCIVEETGAGMVALTPSEAQYLATALYAKYAEWKPILDSPKHTGANLVKHKGGASVAFYDANKGSWMTLNDEPFFSTHYTEILKPSI